nr:probable inactive purple acid phosphatase 27 [Quercus suber]
MRCRANHLRASAPFSFEAWRMSSSFGESSGSGSGECCIKKIPCYSVGSPARTVGWCDPGFIHTSFLINLWPNSVYTYRMGHVLSNGSYIWSKSYSFKSFPYPGQDSLQRVIVFGDMGKVALGIEHCLASADGRKQPWLIFAAHRVLGYSSNSRYAQEGSFEEPTGRESLQKLWQKYRVDIAFYGYVHNYERTCPIYQNQYINSDKSHYSGTVNGTIHVVVGGGGSHLSEFTTAIPNWSIYRDHDWGFLKLTAFNRSSLLFEYKKSSDGKVYDSFTISREYKDVLACVHDSCEPTTLAS